VIDIKDRVNAITLAPPGDFVVSPMASPSRPATPKRNVEFRRRCSEAFSPGDAELDLGCMVAEPTTLRVK
jgi:hypothetical protein